ncbi:MAG: hypothetical protein WA756_21890, partial [Pseudolabrys sp.]
VYWIEQLSRSRRSNRVRFFSTPSVRKQGFERVTDLIEINPRLLFQRQIKLVEFDPEALKQLAIRKAVRGDMAFYRGKETSHFIDKYRASIPRRVGSIIERAYQGRVQQFKNADPDYVNRLKPIPIEVLNLPNRLSWPL